MTVLKAPRPVQPASIADERLRVAHELTLLEGELEGSDAAVAALIGRLAEGVRQGKPDEVRGYVDAIDPRALAELLVDKRAPIWGFVEVARNVLVFAPIAVTWFGLSVAATSYAELIAKQPQLVSQPFLLLWQEGFRGAGVPFNFSALATVDASLIGLLIVLSLIMHVRTEIRDVATRTRALLKESQIRAILGQAIAASTALEIGSAQADALLDQMVAEERRVYERAMEREQQLFDLEGAVSEIKQAAIQLSTAASALNGLLDPKRDRTGDR